MLKPRNPRADLETSRISSVNSLGRLPFSTTPNSEMNKTSSARLDAIWCAIFTISVADSSGVVSNQRKYEESLRLDASKDELNSSEAKIFLKR